MESQDFIPQPPKCGNVASHIPQLAESPCSSGEMLNSPRSPDYPPRASPDTTFVSLAIKAEITMDTAKYSCSTEAVTPGTPVMDEPFGALTNIEKNHREAKDAVSDFRVKVEIENKAECLDEQIWSPKLQKIVVTPVEIDSTTPGGTNATTTTTTTNCERGEKSEKRKEHSSSSDRRHCSRCYKRSKIKRASIGVQCKRDRDRPTNLLQQQQHKQITGTFQKSNSENLRLNLGTKSIKMLGREFGRNEQLENLKYKKFIHIETYPNGGATVVHMYQDEIAVLTQEQVEELAQEYFKVIFTYSSYAKSSNKIIYLACSKKLEKICFFYPLKSM